MEEQEREDLIQRLFALLTVKLEDASALAAEGQNKDYGSENIRSAARKLLSLGQEVVTLADAIFAIASGME